MDALPNTLSSPDAVTAQLDVTIEAQLSADPLLAPGLRLVRDALSVNLPSVDA